MRRGLSRRVLPLLIVVAAACGSGGSQPDAATVAAPGVTPVVPATAAAPAPPPTKAGTATAAGPPALQVRFDKITVKRGMPKSVVRSGVRARMSDVRGCYQRGLAREPRLHGQIEVALAIRKGGKVARSRLQSTTLSDRATANCIVRAARRWAFRGATKRIDAVVRFKLFHT